MDKKSDDRGERRPLLILDVVMFSLMLFIFVIALRNTHHQELEWTDGDGVTKVCKTRLLVASVVCALVVTSLTDLSARSLGMR